MTIVVEVTYCEPDALDIARIAAHMREADREEMVAAAACGPLVGLQRSLDMSHEACVARVDEKAVCVFGLGVGSYLSGIMRPWLMGTPEIEQHGRIFLRSNRVLVQDWAARFDLENWVDARHTVSIRWLQWLGFTVYDPAPFGPFQYPFHRFEMRRQ